MADTIPIECLSGEVIGCTYPNATNYNPLATFDDGSCTFLPTNTGNTFDVNIFATHYSDCSALGIDRGAFFLHIPQITSSSPVTTFHMFVTMFAFNYVYNQGGLQSIVEVPCFGGTDVQNSNIITAGDEVRVANNKKQVISIDNLNPAYVNVFSVLSTDSDHFFGGVAGSEYIPIDIIIYADGVKYTASVDLQTDPSTQQIDDTFTVVVTQ